MPRGNFFEDFHIGQRFEHPLPRTVTDADASLYVALTGTRNPLMSSMPLAASLGHPARPLDDLLVFNLAFGKTVADISLNAVANLGYADVRFLAPVYGGDTIAARSCVIGLRETSSGDSGIVYVRSEAVNQHGQPVLTWARWVLVRKRMAGKGAEADVRPDLPAIVTVDRLTIPTATVRHDILSRATGSRACWEDYAAGQRIDHAFGMTVEESDHMSATRLYQNDARVHFDGLMMRGTRHGRRLVYGGHVMSVCRALACDGLENALAILAINGGTHVAPTFAGDTLYGVTQVIDTQPLPGRTDAALLQLRLIGLRDLPPSDFQWDGSTETLRSHPHVVLDLDHTVLMPRRTA
ncbi:MaoC family dehydratase [Sphingobium sp.]|uniref:MaoC family dehydratase n=1 Tax=Sphingobium sp. TaxID=1912891 RepID=UPI0035C6B28A